MEPIGPVRSICQPLLIEGMGVEICWPHLMYSQHGNEEQKRWGQMGITDGNSYNSLDRDHPLCCRESCWLPASIANAMDPESPFNYPSFYNINITLSAILDQYFIMNVLLTRCERHSVLCSLHTFTPEAVSN